MRVNNAGEPAPRGPVISSVERASPFRRLLERHSSRPGRPAEAARKAEQILSTLSAGAGLCPWEAGSLTRWGDARIPGCVKFELGGGYRMICRRRGGVLVALFLGNHEECHNWLKAGHGLDEAWGEAEIPPATASEPEEHGGVQPAEPSPLLAERTYSDRELRAVFHGLCGG